jgi:single-strand DNA-binding protein
MANEPTTTITGNLTADPELRFTPVSREFAISEGCSAGNRSGGSR